MIQLNQKTVLITGAKGGLGTFVTNAFLDANATVVGVSRSIQQSDFPSSNFVAMPAELSNGATAESLINSIAERFGQIDALVHLMGGFAGGMPVSETDDETVERMLSLNFRSAFQIIRSAVRRMRERGYGRIVVIGSRAAEEPQLNSAAYNASKAALVSLTRTVAMENKDFGITANVILPGTMDTPANRKADPSADFSKWVDPRQVANLALWLSSDDARQVNAAAIPVYGRDV